MYDVSIIGAGVVGTAIARELAKYDLDIALVEKDVDVSAGASKANSGIVHGGYVGKPGTLKGELCIKGNKAYDQLAEELNFGFNRTGGLVIAFNEEEEKKLEEIYKTALKVGQSEDDIHLLSKEQVKKLEPNINDEVKSAFYCESIGVTSPYEMTIALAENAITNGVELKLKSEVIDIETKNDHFLLKTPKQETGEIRSKYVVNAAGVYADEIAAMVGVDNFSIIPRRGQYVLSGKDQGDLVNGVIFQTPSPKTKGVLVTTTYWGNLMLGPNAEELENKENTSTTKKGLKKIIAKAKKSIPDFDISRALTTFSGVRATSDSKDFIVEKTKVDGFINAAGIDSPGLTSSPAIADRVKNILADSGLELTEDPEFTPYRDPIIIERSSDEEAKLEIDHDDPAKNIICRCERITEAEIVEAINRNIEVKSTDAVKRRCRAGMGNCQGNFCQSRVKKLIARENDMELEEVTVRGKEAKPKPDRVPITEIRKL